MQMPPLPPGIEPEEPDSPPDFNLIEPGYVVLYQINEDDSLGIMWGKEDEEDPPGWSRMPAEHHHKMKNKEGFYYYRNGAFDFEEETKEKAKIKHEQEDKIQKKMRELAIKELKKTGELPEDYKEK